MYHTTNLVRDLIIVRPHMDRLLLVCLCLLVFCLGMYWSRKKLLTLLERRPDQRKKAEKLFSVFAYLLLWVSLVGSCCLLAKGIAYGDLHRAESHLRERNFKMAGTYYERHLKKMVSRLESADALLTQYFEVDSGDVVADTLKMLAVDCFYAAGEYKKVIELGFGDSLAWMRVVRAYTKLQHYDVARLYMKATLRQWSATQAMTESDQQYWHDWVEKCIQREGEPEPMTEADKQRALETIKKIAAPKMFEMLEKIMRRE
jgi:hypothetical protein